LKKALVLALMCAFFVTPAIAQDDLGGFGADVGFSKLWVDNKTTGEISDISGAMPVFTFRHVFNTLVFEDGKEVAENGLQFGYGNLASGTAAGEANRVFGQYFQYWKGMHACAGVEADFLEPGDLVTEQTNNVGLRGAVQFPSLIAEKLPFEVSGNYTWNVRGDDVDMYGVFLGFTGTL
jgi:hypothetical protein